MVVTGVADTVSLACGDGAMVIAIRGGTQQPSVEIVPSPSSKRLERILGAITWPGVITVDRRDKIGNGVTANERSNRDREHLRVDEINVADTKSPPGAEKNGVRRPGGIDGRHLFRRLDVVIGQGVGTFGLKFVSPKLD